MAKANLYREVGKTYTQTVEHLKSYKDYSIFKYVYKSKSGLKRVDYKAWSRKHNQEFMAKTLADIKKKIDRVV